MGRDSIYIDRDSIYTGRDSIYYIDRDSIYTGRDSIYIERDSIYIYRDCCSRCTLRLSSTRRIFKSNCVSCLKPLSVADRLLIRI